MWTPQSAVRELREKEGLSQKDLAERLGCNQSAISYIESGSISPGLRLSLKIETWSKGEIPALSWVKPQGETEPAAATAEEGSAAE